MKKNLYIITLIILAFGPLFYTVRLISRTECFQGICYYVADKLKPVFGGKQYSHNPESLANRLLEAQLKKYPDEFIALLDQAVNTFKGDPQAFELFLNSVKTTENEWSSLMLASELGDEVQIKAILNALKKYYGDDEESILAYLNAGDVPDAYTALLIASDYGDYKGLKALVDGAAQLLSPQLFLKFVNATETSGGNTALILLSMFSYSDSINYLVKKAEEIFGKSSEEYTNFINYQNKSQRTALSYALKPIDKNFLIQQGTILKGSPSKEEKEANELGKRLIRAIQYRDLPEIKEIVDFVVTTFKDKPELIVEIFNVVDATGWNPLAHATAEEELVFLKILLSSSTKLLKRSIDIYNMLSSVDFKGKTAIYIAIERRFFEAAKLLIKKFTEFYPNKYRLYNLITTRDQEKGFGSLIATTFNSSDEKNFLDFARYLLEVMAKEFGVESRPFYLFINQLDFNNKTALDYVDSPDMKNLLLEYGALKGDEVVEIREQKLKLANVND